MNPKLKNLKRGGGVVVSNRGTKKAVKERARTQRRDIEKNIKVSRDDG